MKIKILFIPIFSLFLLYSITDVDISVSPEDEVYILKMAPDIDYYKTSLKNIRAKDKFELEIEVVNYIQTVTLENTPTFVGIEHGYTREPKDIYLKQKGQCFDRSRMIEKFLNYVGLENRHVFLFQSDSYFDVYVKKRLGKSHAITEVKTSKGWLIVDSNSNLLPVIENGPISLEEAKNGKLASYLRDKEGMYEEIFYGDFYYVYGLYSRHGMFYPPFIRYIPDINLEQFMYNML